LLEFRHARVVAERRCDCSTPCAQVSNQSRCAAPCVQVERNCGCAVRASSFRTPSFHRTRTEKSRLGEKAKERPLFSEKRDAKGTSCSSRRTQQCYRETLAAMRGRRVALLLCIWQQSNQLLLFVVVEVSTPGLLQKMYPKGFYVASAHCHFVAEEWFL